MNPIAGFSAATRWPEVQNRPDLYPPAAHTVAYRHLIPDFLVLDGAFITWDEVRQRFTARRVFWGGRKAHRATTGRKDRRVTTATTAHKAHGSTGRTRAARRGRRGRISNRSSLPRHVSEVIDDAMQSDPTPPSLIAIIHGSGGVGNRRMASKGCHSR